MVAFLIADLRVDPQVATWLELDTNAKRIPSGELAADDAIVPNEPSEAVVGDGLLRAETSMSIDLRNDGTSLRSDNAAGLKLFFTQASERMAVGQSRATLTTNELPLGFVGTLSALGKGRAQVSGARTYGLARGDALLDHALPYRSGLKAGVSGQAFHAFDNELFSSTTGSFVADVRFQPTDAERLDAYGELGLRGFPFASREPATSDVVRRQDVVAVGSLSLTSARRVFLGTGYTLMRNASNAKAESFTRHRLNLVIGFRLPELVTCTAQGTLQLTQYDDGVSLGQRYFLGDDEESQNLLEVQLARPIFGGISVEARLAFMGNELAVEGARFVRQTAAIGIRADL